MSVFVADLPLHVSITILSRRKLQFAQVAGERANVKMRLDMRHHVAQPVKRFAAGQALPLNIHALCLLVQNFHCFPLLIYFQDSVSATDSLAAAKLLMQLICCLAGVGVFIVIGALAVVLLGLERVVVLRDREGVFVGLACLEASQTV